MDKKIFAHLIALFTIIIWGATFIATKLLLNYLTPFSVLFYRFLLAYIILWIVYPKSEKEKLPLKITLKNELTFLFTGFTGVTLYLLLENTAVSLSDASNVGLIVSSAPMFTAIAFSLFYKEEKIEKYFFIGFIIAFVGIFMVMFSGSSVRINPQGDILAILSAISWGMYSLFYRKAANKGTNIILITRKTFFYGLLTMLPLIPFFGLERDINVLLNGEVIINLLFLGGLASSLCYVTWSYACNNLGSVKTATYIYLIPFVSLLISQRVLDERITAMKISGCILILSGVYVSERFHAKKLTSG